VTLFIQDNTKSAEPRNIVKEILASQPLVTWQHQKSFLFLEGMVSLDYIIHSNFPQQITHIENDQA